MNLDKLYIYIQFTVNTTSCSTNIKKPYYIIHNLITVPIINIRHVVFLVMVVTINKKIVGIIISVHFPA